EKWIPANVKTVIIPIIMELTPYVHLPPREAANALFPQVPCDRPWILFLSRIHEKKGLDVLINAFATLRDKHAQLVIAGTGDAGYVTQMQQLAEQRGVAARTHFVGVVQGQAKITLFRRAQMLVLPSSQENFGIVVAEALACETPVLLTPD